MTATRHTDDIEPLVPELPPEPRTDGGRPAPPEPTSGTPTREPGQPQKGINPLVPDLR